MLGIREIKLNYFFAVVFSCVFYLNFDFYAVFDISAYFQIGIFKRRIRQAVAERKERRACKVAVCSAFHRIIFKGREIVDRAGVCILITIFVLTVSCLPSAVLFYALLM